MKVRKPKDLKPCKMWAYFAPDGFIQVRSIGFTKMESREMISRLESYDYTDYEKRGYKLHRIFIMIDVM